MRTFLAGFCAPGGPLAKAVGIFLEKQPLSLAKAGTTSLDHDRTFLAGFCAPWEVLWQKPRA